MKLRGIMLTMLWCVVPFALHASETTTQQDIPGAYVHPGQKYFVQYCGACHGTDGRGNGPVAPVLRTPPPDLTRIAQRHGGQFPDAEVAAQIDGRAFVRAHGSREMPVWGNQFSEQFGGNAVGEEATRGYLLVLIEYLKSIQE
jgi:mono/diheme cytochrome c family protein